MIEPDDYEIRYFDAKTGNVALTCCKRCGSIVWNQTLHEGTYHDSEATDEEQGDVEIGSGTGGNADGLDALLDADQRAALDANTAEHGGDTHGGSTVGGALDVGSPSGAGDSTPSRPVSSGAARGAGRATAAGSGKARRR